MPPELRVVIVDDEPPARRGIRRAVEDSPGITVVDEADDGVAAVAAIERHRPDLVFLDVRMPGLDGFGVLQALDGTDRPAVVFVTAYEEYALQAFDAHAIDYLLKPFDADRVRAALDRARTWIAGRTNRDPRLDDLLADVATERGRDRFVVRHAGGHRLVHATDVRWIEARGNYAQLHTASGTFLLRESLNALQDSLSAERFQRVHRSAIVAIPAVRAMRRQPSGDHLLTLDDGTEVPLSRTHKAAFAARWGG